MKTFQFSKPINLYCLTDVHIGHISHDEEKFEQVIQMLKKDKDGYCFFNGDIIDFTPEGHHGANGEQRLTNQQQIEAFVRLAKSIGAKKILFMRAGNHELREQDYCGVDLYENLSRELKIPKFDPDAVTCRIKICNKSFLICSTHGEGVSKADAMLKKMKWDSGCDVYFTGHTHELFCNETMQVRRTKWGKEVREQVKVMEVAGGSFLSHATYAKRKGLPPTTTGCYILRFDESGIFARSVT